MATETAWFCMIASMVILIVAVIAMLVVNDDWMMIPAVVVVCVLFVVGSVSWAIGEFNDPHKGVITEKHFVPKHLICSKGCFPVPDAWYFVLDDDGNTGDREVTHSTYDRLSVGDYYEPKE